jgi:hypothetical protein
METIISGLVAILFWLLKGFLALLAILIVFGPPIWFYKRRRFRLLAKARQGWSICQFVRSFDYRRTDTKIIRAVYEGFQEWAIGANFPVKADDSISDIYGMVDEDLDDFAEEVAAKTNRSLTNTTSNPYFGKVETVKDLVIFLNDQSKLTT